MVCWLQPVSFWYCGSAVPMVRFCGCGSWPVRLAELVGSGGWLVVCLCVVGCGFVCVVAFSQICGIFHLHSGHLILTSAPSGNLSCKLFYCKRTRHWSYSWLDIYDANRTESISGSGLPFQSKIPRPSLVVGRKAVERNVMFSDDGESPALVRSDSLHPNSIPHLILFPHYPSSTTLHSRLSIQNSRFSLQLEASEA